MWVLFSLAQLEDGRLVVNGYQKDGDDATVILPEKVNTPDFRWLGDSGGLVYPRLPWLLPQYKSTTEGFAQKEEDFNRLHSQQRVTIEGAFGLLKNRFLKLFYGNALSTKQAILVIIGSCVLHNLCIRTSDDANSELS
ncbi:hypothetical protein HPB48_017583 [Haemaphysalis longicornis]|uniref:DDE Tnp4 domain-containing protein n=1 Tax=Haemaphysalis longicornis TaxID=44386 RepID=A0A9J6GUC3_HAELO|nr:hypothetical protein HPB48_017583 [Haemaphysalis longicornis]